MRVCVMVGVLHAVVEWGWNVRSQVVIKFYRTRQWGVVREFIHPECDGDAQIIRQLTGKLTIDSAVRELIRDLSRGYIIWEEVIAP